jgi:CRP/FNR family transcriptional regulator, cyclic AMP receptor protein
MKVDVDFLALVQLFSRLKREELTGLAERVQHHTFSAGEEIIKEGDTDRRLFVIVHGTVDVIKGRGHRNERQLATFGPRDYFGEMALIDDLARSATVVAKETSELLSLDQWDFRAEIESNPAMALELLRVLSQRVRAMEKIAMNSLGGLLPICLNCKNIRDKSGSWVPIEEYIADRSEAEFTHGMCLDCMKKLYPKHFSQDR